MTYGLGNRVSMWGDRWPLIALDECIAQVDAADPALKEQVRFNLPCGTCRMNTQCLTAKQQELGGLLYDREIRTRPRSAASSLFPLDRMLPMCNRNLQLVDRYRKPDWIEERYGVATGWDVAWSEKAGGDYLAKFTALLDRKTGKKRILDIARWQRISFADQCELIEEESAKYSDDITVVENDFSQRVWVQYLTSRTSVPVVGHSAGSKKSFEIGVPLLLLDVERQVWEIPYAPDGRKIDLVKTWLAECEAFGWQDDKLEGVGEHDDLVMAWWHCNWGLEKMRVPYIARTRAATVASRGVEI